MVPPDDQSSQDRVHKLSDQFVDLLCRPEMFRDSNKGALLLVYMQRDDMQGDPTKQWVDAVAEKVSGLTHIERKNVAHGLSEARKVLGDREPGERTDGALALWEQVVDRLPEEFRQLAVEGVVE